MALKHFLIVLFFGTHLKGKIDIVTLFTTVLYNIFHNVQNPKACGHLTFLFCTLLAKKQSHSVVLLPW